MCIFLYISFSSGKDSFMLKITFLLHRPASWHYQHPYWLILRASFEIIIPYWAAHMWKQRQTEHAIFLQATKKSWAENWLKSWFLVHYLDDFFFSPTSPVVQHTNTTQFFLEHSRFGPVFQKNIVTTVIMAEPSWVSCRKRRTEIEIKHSSGNRTWFWNFVRWGYPNRSLGSS